MVKTVYRHLLRSTSHAVRHDKAATRNIRRLLRDDFEFSVKVGLGEEQLVKQAGNTMLLHLASTRAKEDTSARDAHRIIRNLSSLCYHHLSPHTRMQPISRRIGGTDTTTLRRRRGSNGLKSKVLDGASLAMKSFELPATRINAAPPDLTVLPSLVVASKPIRGPIANPFSRRFLPGRWDGQKTVRIIQTTDAFVAHLESMVESLSEETERAEERFGRYSIEVQELRTKIKKVKGEVKGAIKTRQKVDDRRAIQSGPADILHSVITKAQANNGIWLGARRFEKWASGAWLPP